MKTLLLFALLSTATVRAQNEGLLFLSFHPI
jgi:hypothetical protein